MSHSPSRHKVELENRRIADEQAKRQAAANERLAARGRRWVNLWNIRAKAELPAEIFPTFQTAIVAGFPLLSFKCPSCRQGGTVDLRIVGRQHHPRAAISVLIPRLSCQRCRPNARFVVLGELSCTALDKAMVSEVWKPLKAAFR